MDASRLLACWLLSAPAASSVRLLSFEKPIAAVDDGKFASQWAALDESQRAATLNLVVDAMRPPGAMEVTERGTFYLVEQLEDLSAMANRPSHRVADAFALASGQTKLIDIITFLGMSYLLDKPMRGVEQARRVLFSFIVDAQWPLSKREQLHRAVYTLFDLPYDPRDIAKEAETEQARGRGNSNDENAMQEDEISPSYTVPTLVARHMALRLSPSDRQLLAQVSRTFDSLVRDDDVEVYRASLDEMYPAFGRLFDHELPSWLVDAVSARGAALEKALHERLGELVELESKVDAELSDQRRLSKETDVPLALSLAKTRADIATARTLINEMSIRNTVHEHQHLRQREIDRSNQGRAWQQLLRSLNAIATHPSVRHSLLTKNLALAYDGAPVIIDGERFAAVGLDSRVDPPFTVNYSNTHVLRNTGAHLTSALSARPMFTGRYYVFDRALLAERHRTPFVDVSVYKGALVEKRSADGAPGYKQWHVYRTTDAVDNYQEITTVKVESPSGLVARSLVLSNRDLGEATGDRRTLRVIAAAKWQPSESAKRKANSDAEDMKLTMAVGAVDELLISALEHFSTHVAAIWSPDGERTPSLTYFVELRTRNSLGLLDLGLMADYNAETMVRKQIERRRSSGISAWREPWFAQLLQETSVSDELMTQTQEVFERLFGTLGEWKSRGKEGQFTAVDYCTLRLLFIFVVYRRATFADVKSHEVTSIAGVTTRENFTNVMRHWTEALQDARNAATAVRDTGFDAIRADPARRDNFVARLHSLDLDFDDVFGDGALKRRASNEAEGEADREKRARN